MKFAALFLAAFIAVNLRISAVRAADATPSPSDVSRLIAELGDTDYATRTRAFRRLKQLGKPALAALKEAGASPDPEIRQRAALLASRIEFPVVPGPAPGADDPGFARQLNPGPSVTISNLNGIKAIKINEAGRQISISESPEGIEMSVTGWLDGENVTENYKASSAVELERLNPEAFDLYDRYAAIPATRLIVGGQMNGNIVIHGGFAGNFVFGQPDALHALRQRLRQEMADKKIPADQQRQVLEQLTRIREAGLRVAAEGITVGNGAGNGAGNGVANGDRPPQQPQLELLRGADDLRRKVDELNLHVALDDALPPPPKSRLGMVITTTGNITVQSVLPGSRAERIGLKPGDVITKVAGQDITTAKSLRDAITAHENGIAIQVERIGTPVTLSESDAGPTTRPRN